MPKKFSQIYGLNASQAQLDFVDISPDVDTPLFIDPFAISLRQDEWSEDCHEHIKSFFDSALKCVRAGNVQKGQELLNGLSEPNETCLGLSKGRPSGRGVSGKQAMDLFSSLANSSAAKSGLLQDLADCDLFVSGIGPDKISDITTNILRFHLVRYTQEQCNLHGISLDDEYPTGKYWDIANQKWSSHYEKLPVIDGRVVILVPKYSVRRNMAINSQEFYNFEILNFIEREEILNNTSLVRTLKKDGSKRVYKKDLKEKYPFSKDFIARFVDANPNVLAKYKAFYSTLPRAKGTLENKDFDENFDEVVLAKALIEQLGEIVPGKDDADKYHSFMIGALEFIFWPNLMRPVKEDPIHDGRKRIDITYSNAFNTGFFKRVETAHQIASLKIMVECKNYSKDPANPELDQIAGRFGVNRGRLGFMVYRSDTNYELVLRRCKDTVNDGRGFIIPLNDKLLIELLTMISNGDRQSIDTKLEKLFNILLS